MPDVNISALTKIPVWRYYMESDRNRRGGGGGVKALAKNFLICLATALVFFAGFQLALQQFRVQQASMLPSFEEGQRVIITKVGPFFREPERGDVIVFDPPDGGSVPLIKRVIGLPGETVEVKEGSAYIEGIPLEEPYIRERPLYTFKPYTVQSESYFVLGDNRNNSRDSHEGWTVPRSSIIGKALFTLWPPCRLGPLPQYEYAVP